MSKVIPINPMTEADIHAAIKRGYQHYEKHWKTKLDIITTSEFARVLKEAENAK